MTERTGHLIQAGTCVLCNTECTREPGGTWYNFFGRDQCKLDPDEGPHVVPEWTERERPPQKIPAHAKATLHVQRPDGQVAEISQQVPVTGNWSEWFTEPMTVIGWHLSCHPEATV
jgi:hypothetical protein